MNEYDEFYLLSEELEECPWDLMSKSIIMRKYQYGHHHVQFNYGIL